MKHLCMRVTWIVYNLVNSGKGGGVFVVYLEYCSACIFSSVSIEVFATSVSGVLASFPGSLLKKQREETVVVTSSRKLSSPGAWI